MQQQNLFEPCFVRICRFEFYGHSDPDIDVISVDMLSLSKREVHVRNPSTLAHPFAEHTSLEVGAGE
jgi:hypothetical protein